MALTAKFTTDFQSFYDAVQKANSQLIDWERNAENLGKTLTESVTKFSGKELIQNATLMAKAIEDVGGVSKLTASELETVSKQTAEAVDKMKRLGIDVPPELQKLADSQKDVQSSTDELTGAVTKLFAGYLTGAAVWEGLKAGFTMLVGFMKESVAASAAAEQSQGRLMNALRAQGLAVPDVVDAYQGYIRTLALTTTHQSDQLTSVAALLTQYGVMPRDMEAALTAVANLATGERDLDTAAQLVAKAAQGQTGALQKAGIVIDDTGGKAASFSSVVGQVNDQLKNAATDAANTYSGKLANLGKAWGDIQEKLGDAITQNQTVRDLIGQVTNMLSGNTDALGNNRQLLNLVSDVVIVAVKAFSLFAQVVAKTGESFASSLKELAFFADGIEGILDLLTRFVRILANLGDVTAKQVLPKLEGATAKTAAFRDGLYGAAQRTQEFSKYAGDVAVKVDQLAANLATTRGQTVQLTAATQQSSDAFTRQTVNIKAGSDASKEAAKEQERLAKLDRDVAAALIPLTAAQQEQVRALKAQGLEIGQIAHVVKASDTAVKNFINTQIKWEESTRAFGAAALTTIPKLESFRNTIDGVFQLNTDFSYALTQAQIKTDSFGHVIQSKGIPAIKGMGPPLVEATDAAGDLGKGLAAAFVQIAQVSGPAMADTARNIGTVLTAMNAASQGTQAFSKGLQSFKTGNTTQGLVSMAGGAASVYGAFQQATSSTSKLSNTLNGAAVGFSVAGPWGAAVGGAIGLIKSFAKASEETAKVSPLRDEFFKLQGGLETLNPRIEQLTGNVQLVQAVFDAKTVEQYNKALADLNAVFTMQETAFTAVNDAAERYGLTIEELGPAMARQNLDKQAQQLYKDWQLLTSAGVQTETVTKRMAAATNEYLQQALLMGTEVPEAMRPMLQQMAQMGQLTDASGNKIENLEDSGITFSMSMTEGFKALITEVQKLSEVLSRSLGTAVDSTITKINKIPNKVPVEIYYKDPGPPSQKSASVPGFQGGTHGQFVDFGAGTLTMLHGREAIVPERDQSLPMLSPRAAPAAAAPIVVTIDARGALFGPGSELELARLVERALSNNYNLKHTVRAA